MTELGFQPVSDSLFFSKEDEEDRRWGETVQRLFLSTPKELAEQLSLKEPGWVLGGYPDDEGISLNGGRPGAKEASQEIRKYFYRTTPSTSSFSLCDVGDVDVSLELSERHERGRSACRVALENGHRWMGLGGGHDYGYADGAGFLDVFKDNSPVVINFDAHLDVRPTTGGLSSGTPFRRILESYPQTSLWEVGLLKVCNSPHHVEWAKNHGAHIHFWEDIQSTAPAKVLAPLKTRTLPRPTFLSVDLDVFSSAIVPGCSQSWPGAMDLGWFLEALDFLQETCDIKAVGFYEVSPPLDLDGRTSRLVAQLMHRLLERPGS